VEVIDRPFSDTRRPHTPAWAAQTEPAGVDDVDDESDEAPYANGGVAANDAAVLEQRNGDVLKVSARSRPSAVAGAIAGVVRENGRAEVQAIGAGATNQAVKAVAIARDYLRETGIEAICLPAFIDVTIDNEDRTAIRLVVEPR
jgi:stage V sporulation protein S